MQSLFYSLLEEIDIRGVIHGSLVWGVCNPAAPEGLRDIPGLSPEPHVLAKLEGLRDIPGLSPEPHVLAKLEPGMSRSPTYLLNSSPVLVANSFLA